MKKKTPQLKKLLLQKTAITVLNKANSTRLLGGATGDGCEAVPSGVLTCYGNTCESWYTEDPTCRNCM